MSLVYVLASFVIATASAISTQQVPLSAPGDRFDLIKELRRAEIIPTVLDPFQPFLSVNISWKKADAEMGNTIKTKLVQEVPDVFLLDVLPDFELSSMHGELPQLTVALTDPDARSRDDPDWSEMCHWIATHVPLTQAGRTGISSKLTDIMPYQPPGPPPKTGKHRYVFVALAPLNGTHDELHLSKPNERRHWGYGKERAGLRAWAAENGLVVVGANFIYAQNKKQ